jgi:hypothetical protein
MTSLQEYDLKFKLTDIIKGQGLCKLVTGIIDVGNQEENGWKEEIILYTH